MRLKTNPPRLRIHRQPKPCARPWRPHFPSAPRLLPLGVPSYLPSWPDPMRSHEIWPPDHCSDVQPLGVDFLTFFPGTTHGFCFFWNAHACLSPQFLHLCGSEIRWKSLLFSLSWSAAFYQPFKPPPTGHNHWPVIRFSEMGPLLTDPVQ